MGELEALQAEFEARQQQVTELEATLAGLQEELAALKKQILGEVPWYKKYAPHLAIIGAVSAVITYYSLKK